MKNLSRWANRHVVAAVLILIGCEVLNALNGLLLGLTLLNDWPADCVALLMVCLAGGAVFVRARYRADQPYAVGRRWLFAAFLGNYLLFGALGGLWTERVQRPTPNRAAFGYRQAITASDSLKPVPGRSTNQADYYTSRSERAAGDQTGKRVLYVLLFLLGLFLSGLAAGLACNLACAGYGAAAGLLLLVGAGVLFGGFFFLSRAFDKVLRPWREMSRNERRRTLLRAVFLLLGVWALSVLLGAATN